MTAPVADGFVGGIFQRLVATLYWHHRGSQHLHAFHVHVLTLNIKGSLIHCAGHVHQCTSGGCCHTVLTCTCLGNDTLLAHLLGKENLTEGIVDFVGTRVVEVFTLEIELTTILLTHTLSKIEWRRASNIVFQQGVILALELLTLQDGEVSFFQILHCLVENLWNVGSSELSVETIFIYLVCHHILYNFLIYDLLFIL